MTEDPALTPDPRPTEPGAAASHRADDDAALRAEVDAELAAERRQRRLAPRARTGLVLLLGAAVAWAAALVLLVDKMQLIADPGSKLGCDVNPFISCGSVMMTWQASAFGIPNMAIGLGGFAIMGTVGALLLSRVQPPRWFRWAVLGGLVFAFGFIHFLALSAIFVIRALCPWCMVVWVATAPMFFAYLAHMVEERDLPLPGPIAMVLRHWVILTVLWYVLVAVTILLAFLPQWMAMAGL